MNPSPQAADNRLAFLPYACLAFALTLVTGYRVNPLWYQGDSPRHAANGAFYLDLPGLMARRGNLVEAARVYYAARPAIAPQIWPPVFPVAEATAFWAFGVSTEVARAVVWAFQLMALTAALLILRPLVPMPAAIGASLLMAACPAVVLYTNTVMLEIPCLTVCLLSTLAVVHAATTGSRVALFALFPSQALAVLTKQQAVFLLPFTVGLWLVSRRFAMLRSRALWAGIVLGVLLLIPWAYVTYRHAWIMVYEGVEAGHFRLLEWANWAYYPRELPSLLGYPILVCAVLGIGMSCFRGASMPRPLAVGLHLWAASVYLCSSLLSLKEQRYFIFIIPYFAVFASWFLYQFASVLAARASGKTVASAFVVLLAMVSAGTILSFRPPRAPSLESFRDVVRYVSASSPHDRATSVFYDGLYDGVFVFLLREHDKDAPVVTFRGQKHLYATRFHAEWGTETLTSSQEEIARLLAQLNCSYVVIEATPSPDLAPSRELRQLLRNPDLFEEVQSIQTGGPTGALLIYRSKVFDPEKSVPEKVGFSFPAAGSGVREWLDVDVRGMWPRLKESVAD